MNAPDKTVEVSQAARELLPCPFCGGEPSVSTYETESLWSHNIVTYTQVGCGECDYSFASEPGYETEAPHRWNTRATQPEAALREAEAKLEFTRGYLLAVANIVHTHDEDVIATDVLGELGEKEGAIKHCGFDDYDAKPLRKLFREMKRRNAYCRAAALQKENHHG